MDALENFDVKDLLKSFIERIFENDSIDAYFPKNVTDQARKHFIKVLKYNLLGGKMHRGCSIISGHKILCNWFDEPATQVDIQRCCAIGACIEILQYGFLMADDIMDNSTMRRGKACWHCLPEIEKTAINDSMFLSHYIYFILRKFLVDAEYYLHIVHLFQDTIINTISGQCMDMLTSRPNESCNLSKFTMEQYLLIITEKTGYYSFNLPVIACLLMQKIYDKKVHEKATKVLLKMGRYFQIQDDYLDCFGNPDDLGKIGTDIQENKCTWLICKALEVCNDEEKGVLEKHYGKDNEFDIQQIKKMYSHLKIDVIYGKKSSIMYKELKAEIIELGIYFPPQLFLNYLELIHNRQK